MRMSKGFISPILMVGLLIIGIVFWLVVGSFLVRKVLFKSKPAEKLPTLLGEISLETPAPEIDKTKQEVSTTPSPTPTPTPIPLPSGKMAFVSNRDGNKEIYLFKAGETTPINLTNDPADDWNPALSPDGSRIAFVSSRDDNPEIYIMNSDGNNPERLTSNEAADDYPDWFPDGSKIIFSRAGKFEKTLFRLFIIDKDGTDEKQLSLADSTLKEDDTLVKYHHIGPAVAPDGQKIAFSGGNWDSGWAHGIYVIDLGGKLVEKYKLGSFSWAKGPRDLYSPVWADEKKLVFCAHYSSKPSGIAGQWGRYSIPDSWAYGGHEVWQKNLYSTEVKKLADGDYPVFSSDGNSMIYTRSDNNICIMDLKTQISSELTSSGDSWSPSWWTPL